jgi:hypothetical protein
MPPGEPALAAAHSHEWVLRAARIVLRGHGQRGGAELLPVDPVGGADIFEMFSCMRQYEERDEAAWLWVPRMRAEAAEAALHDRQGDRRPRQPSCRHVQERQVDSEVT